MRETEMLRKVARPGTPEVLTQAGTALSANKNMLGWFRSWVEPAEEEEAAGDAEST